MIPLAGCGSPRGQTMAWTKTTRIMGINIESDSQEKFRKGRATETRRYRWFEDVPLRDGEDAMHVNWIGMEIVDAKGKVKFVTAVTSLPVSKYNVAEIAACGRGRWKIENEGFNVMKN